MLSRRVLTDNHCYADFTLNDVQFLLRCDAVILDAVIILLRPHIQYETNGEQFQIADGYTEFHAPQEEQGRGHFPR